MLSVFEISFVPNIMNPFVSNTMNPLIAVVYLMCWMNDRYSFEIYHSSYNHNKKMDLIDLPLHISTLVSIKFVSVLNSNLSLQFLFFTQW